GNQQPVIAPRGSAADRARCVTAEPVRDEPLAREQRGPALVVGAPKRDSAYRAARFGHGGRNARAGGGHRRVTLSMFYGPRSRPRRASPRPDPESRALQRFRLLLVLVLG